MEPPTINVQVPPRQISGAKEESLGLAGSFWNWGKSWFVEKGDPQPKVLSVIEQQKPEKSLEEREAEVEAQLSPLHKGIRSRIMTQVKKKVDSLLGRYVRFNENKIVQKIASYTIEKASDSRAQKVGDMGSFASTLLSSKRAEWDRVLNKLEQNAERFPDYFQQESAPFDKQRFEKNPIAFLLEAQTHSSKTDLAFVIGRLASEDPEFKADFEALAKESKSYFWEAVKGIRMKDPVYSKAAVRYDELLAMQEAIHECDENDWDELDRNFEEAYGDEFRQQETICGQKEVQQFQELANAILKNDDEYNTAKQTLDTIMRETSTDEFDFTRMYCENRRFREAYDLVNRKLAGIGNLTGVPKPRGEVEVDAIDLAAIGLKQGLGDLAQHISDNKGKYIITPATVLGTACVSVYVAPIAVGAVFAGQVVKQVAPMVTEELEKGGVFYDIRQAHLDRIERGPYLTKIFAEDMPVETRMTSLETLRKENLLFQEDLAGLNPELLAQFKQKYGEDWSQKLPSMADIKEARKSYLRDINDPRKPMQGRISMFIELYEASKTGSVPFYKQDYDNAHTDIQNAFKAYLNEQGETLESLQLLDIEEQRGLRNDYLFIAKGVLVDDARKLNTLQELHSKGLVFKEDIVRLQKENPNLAETFLANAGREGGITLNDLPDPTDRYATDHSLKADHDIKRAAIFEESDRGSMEKPTLAGIQALKAAGLCFKQDVDRLAPNDKQAFLDELKDSGWIYRSYDDLPDQDTFYDYGLAKKAMKTGEAMANLIWQGGKAIYNNPVNIVYGPMKGAKGIANIGAKAMDATFGTFTDVKTTALQDNLNKIMPSDKRLTEHSSFIFNKGVGAMKWSVFGTASGLIISSWIPIPGARVAAAKIGALVGAIIGLFRTDGKVSQIPRGGFIRAMGFAARGAAAGGILSGVGLAAAATAATVGAVSLGTAITIGSIATGGFLPLLLLGALAGYQLADYTGVDAGGKFEDPVGDLAYKEPSFEQESSLLHQMPELAAA